MNKDFVPNKKGWKIRSNTGFVNFAGISTMGIKQCYRVTLFDDNFVDASSNHVFYTISGTEISVKDIKPGTELIGIENKTVRKVEKIDKQQTYDIVHCTGHVFYANGLLCHNCEFLSSDALLVDSLTLTNITHEIKDVLPKYVIKDVMFFDDIKKGETYLVGVDPATGAGNDFSAITVFEFPSMIQVAEYRSNIMSTNELYNVLKNLLLILEQHQALVYFSIENNGVGEGVISLYEADENPPENAEFVSEMGAKKRGMTTTKRTKLKACVNLREMIENGTLHIKSKMLLSELKQFARTRGSYAAQLGSTDDCVSAALIVTRLIEEIATYDQQGFDLLYSGRFEQWSENDWDEIDGDYDERDFGLPMAF